MYNLYHMYILHNLSLQFMAVDILQVWMKYKSIISLYAGLPFRICNVIVLSVSSICLEFHLPVL